MRQVNVFSVLVLCCGFASAEDVSVQDATTALKRGVEYFRGEVSMGGGYLWRYTADFAQQEGEVPASKTTVWVQPPGTPAVGEAYLTAYELTGDAYYLEAAVETARALVQGQLQSGGWDYRIEFAPEDRKKYAYRADGRTEGRNTTTLDDNTTQAALRFLMAVDRALDFKDEAIHGAAMYALKKIMEAQYPNGAWPQRYSEAPDPAKYPVKAASYPEEWPKTYPKESYSDFYTFNDNTHADVIMLMFFAAEIYGDDTYAAAARRGGDFMILAQMPDPQPGWAQQYNAEMHPAWARKFEPASITGGESQGVMRTLLRIYEITGDRKYLEPLPRALAYYRSSVLEDGRMARFYELKTNKPLYFTREDYEVTYSDADMPTHYAFKTGNSLDAIEADYMRLSATTDEEWSPAKLVHIAKPGKRNEELIAAATSVVAAQNPDGAWIEAAKPYNQGKIEVGTPVLISSTFNKNIRILAEYIAAK